MRAGDDPVMPGTAETGANRLFMRNDCYLFVSAHGSQPCGNGLYKRVASAVDAAESRSGDDWVMTGDASVGATCTCGHSVHSHDVPGGTWCAIMGCGCPAFVDEEAAA